MRRRTAARVLTVTACVPAGLLSAVAGAPSAQAHTELRTSLPANGSTISAAPTELQLAFSGSVSAVALTVVVTAPDGTPVGDGKPSAQGESVRQQLRPLPLDGRYQVAYRVVSSDGHPVAGATEFVLDRPGVAAVVPEPVAPEPVPTGPPFPEVPAVLAVVTAAGAAGVLVVRGRRGTVAATGEAARR